LLAEQSQAVEEALWIAWALRSARHWLSGWRVRRTSASNVLSKALEEQEQDISSVPSSDNCFSKAKAMVCQRSMAGW